MRSAYWYFNVPAAVCGPAVVLIRTTVILKLFEGIAFGIFVQLLDYRWSGDMVIYV